jgi:hypothetical protein
MMDARRLDHGILSREGLEVRDESYCLRIWEPSIAASSTAP